MLDTKSTYILKYKHNNVGTFIHLLVEQGGGIGGGSKDVLAISGSKKMGVNVCSSTNPQFSTQRIGTFLEYTVQLMGFKG